MHASRGRRLGIVVGSGLGILLVLAGVLYFTGTLEKGKDRWDLSRACKGTLDAGSVRAALGGQEVYAEDGTQTDSEAAPSGTPPLASCHMAVRGGRNSMEVEIRREARHGGVSQYLQRNAPAAQLTNVAPLGTWPGVLTADQGLARSSLTLKCGSKKGEGLAVDARLAHPVGTSMETSEPVRTSFARATVKIAEAAAGEFGCAYRPGKLPARVPADPRVHPVDLSAAGGTCRDLRPLAAAAGRSGVPRAWDSRAGSAAPVEDCVLATSDGQRPGYRISSYYGSYADSFAKSPAMKHARGERGFDKKGTLAWATARCPGTDVRALYTFSGIYDPSGGDIPVRHRARSFEFDALKAYAAASARRHGCTDLRTPG